jgi:hypothetical protein
MEEKIKRIIENDQDNSKISIKMLKEWIEKNHPTQIDNIFDPKDTCFCSLTNRKQYKQKFISFYNTL